MISLIQRVSHASVTINEQKIGSIHKGILALIGIEKTDTKKEADRLIERILGYRIFQDDGDKMNLSLQDIDGGLLLVPQFTLVADTKKGMRPSFSSAAPPEMSKQLFDYVVKTAKQQHRLVATGQFGANMQVSLCNDGPVTFMIQTT